LEHNALHDALTDLPNRRLFLDRLRRAFERARKGPEYEFAVLFVDIDGFKTFNDTMGHRFGDELIVEIGHRLHRCLRFDDTVSRLAAAENNPSDDEVLARLGGDEFIILVGSIHEPGDAMRIANRIQDSLSSPLVVEGREVFISASIGIALSTTQHAEAEELLRDADIAMYRAKMLGKARCEFFDQEMHTRAVKQLELETGLRRAVSGEEFRVHYQPIVRLTTGEIAGFEALVRWQRPGEGLLAPASFIDALERTGLVVPLGGWTLRTACRQAQVWQRRYPQSPALSVTVNVSPKQFTHPYLANDVEEVLRETGIDPGRLHLEITESTAMADPARTKLVLSQLKNLGVGICLDDFGTGHSSLGRLRQFPVDILKIDRSFIMHVDRDVEARAIVRLIVEFAHTINMQVIAEGAESADHIGQLRALGCEYGQGYFFSRPVDQDGVEGLLAAGRVHLDWPTADRPSRTAVGSHQK